MSAVYDLAAWRSAARAPEGARQLLLVAAARDLHHVDHLQRHLARRGFVTAVGVYGAAVAAACSWSPATTHLVALLPRPSGDADDERPEDVAALLTDEYRGFPVTLVVRPGQRVPRRLARRAWQVLVDQGIDGLLRDVVRSATGPAPAWLDAVFAADHVIEPAGVAWSSDALVVADACGDHLVQVGADGRTTVVLPGLADPHDVAVHDRQLFLANTGDDAVVTASLRQGQAAAVREVEVTGVTPPGVESPRAAGRGGGALTVADTGHERVVVRRPGEAGWRELAAPYPVGRPGGRRPPFTPTSVAADDRHVWVADAGERAVDVYDLDRLRHVARYRPAELGEPAAVARWGRLAVVAGAGSSRLQVLDVRRTGPDVTLRAAGEIVLPLGARPSSLAVDRAGRLAAADRVRGCVWLVALPDALAATA